MCNRPAVCLGRFTMQIWFSCEAESSLALNSFAIATSSSIIVLPILISDLTKEGEREVQKRQGKTISQKLLQH